jgi:hypothetical protein
MTGHVTEKGRRPFGRVPNILVRNSERGGSGVDERSSKAPWLGAANR